MYEFQSFLTRFLRTFQCNSEISLLFNFQRPNRSVIADPLILLCFLLAVFCPQVDSLPIIHQTSTIVKPFLKVFLRFFRFFRNKQVRAPKKQFYCKNKLIYFIPCGRVYTYTYIKGRKSAKALLATGINQNRFNKKILTNI